MTKEDTQPDTNDSDTDNGALEKSEHIVHDDGTATYKFLYPVGISRDLETVTCKRFLVEDLFEFAKVNKDIYRSRAMLVKSTGLSPNEVMEMDAKDYHNLDRLLADFL